MSKFEIFTKTFSAKGAQVFNSIIEGKGSPLLGGYSR